MPDQSTPANLGVSVPAASSSELCWNLGDAVIRRRFVLACR